MMKDTDFDIAMGQYKLPLNLAFDSPAGAGAPAKFVVRMTPEAGAAIKAQAAEIAQSATKRDTFYHVCRAAAGGEDVLPIGDSFGATLRGAMSVIDSVFDPLSVVKQPIHKTIGFVFDEACDVFLSTRGMKNRVAIKRGPGPKRMRRDEERLVG